MATTKAQALRLPATRLRLQDIAYTERQVSGCYDYDIDHVVPCSTTNQTPSLSPTLQLPVPMSTPFSSVTQLSAVSTHHVPNASSSKVAATPLPLSTPSPDPGRRSRQAYRESYNGAPVSPRQPMEISHSTATLRPQETHTADGDTSAADELECLSHASQATRTFIHIEEYSIPDVPPPPYDE
ncbi:predicted protein [Postia placenta Mad-698-R]|uniref:Uncharacterized protein n=1 Tax=Postia placenta MAD-698-R-SB12 TaxID=670580 RepID=A0A1X6NEW0_9APHY|nr:hypothetical protein POSPLADRAFT_1042332 [Postia placenta MAD-698-R-SB12]EED80876.1 predicted protein [Postia placenta Mad-698-R]OSX67052.1 hypothetical protein POSPLADRAFT_1042332 [Postia placenta MAD-698-R-SB12]